MLYLNDFVRLLREAFILPRLKEPLELGAGVVVQLPFKIPRPVTSHAINHLCIQIP